MDESKALEVIEGEFVQLGTLQVSGPLAVIGQATEIATHLADIVEQRKLYTNIGGKKHVRVEGWTTLGAMLGVLPREVAVSSVPADEFTAGGYEAIVELVRAGDGAVIGRASAICTRDERNWGNRPDYAVRSMAVTRATGKAFRLGFSWIMTLAGYEPTPAEEMPRDPAPRPKTHRASASSPVIKVERPLSPDKLQTMLFRKVDGKPEVHKMGIATPGQQGLVAGKLSECFAGDEDAKAKRHKVTEWLFGKESVKDLTMAEAGAILDWVLDKDGGEGTYDLHPSAAVEANAMLREALKDAGQTEMPLEAHPMPIDGEDARDMAGQ